MGWGVGRAISRQRERLNRQGPGLSMDDPRDLGGHIKLELFLPCFENLAYVGSENAESEAGTLNPWTTTHDPDRASTDRLI